MEYHSKVNKLFNAGTKEFTKNLLLFNLKNFRQTPFFIKNAYFQYKALKRRKKMKKEGVVVPAVLALSITNKCNLNCKGCYLKSQQREKIPEFTDDEIMNILNESRDLGSSIVLLLGGEPLLRDIFMLTSNFKNMIFGLFTNSTLINDNILKKLKKNNHIIPMLSMEGSETDSRRGKGVLEKIETVLKKMQQKKIMCGLSFTVTRNNFDEVCNDTFIKKYIKKGSKYFAFFKYIPIDKNTIDMTLTPEQEVKFDKFATTFRERHKTLILSPANEKKYGGCLGAGQGVAHINYDGAMEVCPFAPFSDISVKNISVKEALQSKLFANLRKHHKEMISCNMQMCSLWKDDNWNNAVKTNDFSFLEN